MSEQYTAFLLISLAGVCIYVLGRLDGRDANYTLRDVNIAHLLGYLNAQYFYQHRLNQRRDGKGRFI